MTGFSFFDVRVLEEPAADGVNIIFQVRGKATLKDVVFEGNKIFKTERLKRETSQKAGDIIDERKAHADTLKMEELYQKGGWPDVKIEPIVTIDKDTGKAILKFKVTEGDRVFIRQVKYTGLKAYPAGQLNKLIKTRRRWFGSWLAGTGVLKEDQFQEDIDKIRDHYRSHGYIDMEIKTNYVERVAKKWMDIHINIFEGQQYKVGDLKIEGNKLFATVDLMKRLKMTSGQIFTPDGLAKDLKLLEDYYGARGYLDTAVRSAREPNIETGKLDLTYTIKEGEQWRVGKINVKIAGENPHTRQNVVLNRISLRPGDIIDLRELRNRG